MQEGIYASYVYIDAGIGIEDKCRSQFAELSEAWHNYNRMKMGCCVSLRIKLNLAGPELNLDPIRSQHGN